MKGLKIIILLSLAYACFISAETASTTSIIPRYYNVVFDNPDDSGNSIIILSPKYWFTNDNDSAFYPVTILRKGDHDTNWIKVNTFTDDFEFYIDSNLTNDTKYEYTSVFSITKDSIQVDYYFDLGSAVTSAKIDSTFEWPSKPVFRYKQPTREQNYDYIMYLMAYRQHLIDNLNKEPKVSLMDKSKFPLLIGTILAYLIFRLTNFLVKKRGVPKIRKVAGLNAVDEAIGRATEMGKPVLFTPGWGGDIQRPTTIAALNILSLVAEKTASYNCDLIFPTHDPVIMSAAEETVQNAYLNAGHPDLYNPDNIYYTTSSQFGYAAAVDGAITRLNPATVFLLGTFEGEALILAETANSVGAMQIAGTDSTIQLAFFLVACDYTLIGEELFAASGYLSKDEKIISSIKAQDYMKIIIVALIIAGSIASTFGSNLIKGWFK